MALVRGEDGGGSRWSDEENGTATQNASPMEIPDVSSQKRSFKFKLKLPSKRPCPENNKDSLCSVPKKDNILVDNTPSTQTENEVVALFKTANISFNRYEALIPSKEQRANKPPEGYISVYEEQIEAGLRFPLHDLVIEICKCMRVSPSQLVPNAHRMIVCFILCAQFYKIPVTADYFFALIRVHSCPTNGIYFCAHEGLLFLTDIPSVHHHGWRMKFFFIRPLKESWNCPTEWSSTLSVPSSNDSLAKLAVELGITKHRFKITDLLRKNILVLGKIEPGTPSSELTFQSVMNMIKSTAPVTAEDPETPCSSSQKIPSETDEPLGKDFAASSKDSTPLNEHFHKRKENQTDNTLESAVTDGPAQLQALPSPLLAVTQVLESVYVPKECYQKLEVKNQGLTSKLTSTKSQVEQLKKELEHVKHKSKMEMQKVTSELTVTKSRVEELEQELKLSEAKIVQSEKRTCRAMGDVKRLEKTVKDLKSESVRYHDKITNEAINAYKSSDEFLENCEKIKKDAVVDYKRSQEYFDSLYGERDKITKEAVNAYNSSNEFLESCERIKKDAVNDFKRSQEYFHSLHQARDKITKEAINAYKSSNEFSESCERIKMDAVKGYKHSKEYFNSLYQARDKITKEAINAYKSSNEFSESCERIKMDAVKDYKQSKEYFNSLHQARDKITKEAINAYKSSNEFSESCERIKMDAVKDYKQSKEYFNSLHQARDKITKEAINAYKSSNEFSESCERIKIDAVKDYKQSKEYFNSLHQARDKITKEAINAYKSSNEFSESCERIKMDAVTDYKHSDEYFNSLHQARDNITKEAINAYESSNVFLEICERMKKNAVKDFQCSGEYFNSLHRAKEIAVNSYKSSAEFLNFRDNTRKEAIDVYKTSSDFYSAVWEESVKYHHNGFDACKFQFLKSGQLPKGFNFCFLDPTAGMFDKPPEQVHGGSSTSTSALKMKSIKPDI